MRRRMGSKQTPWSHQTGEGLDRVGVLKAADKSKWSVNRSSQGVRTGQEQERKGWLKREFTDRKNRERAFQGEDQGEWPQGDYELIH